MFQKKASTHIKRVQIGEKSVENKDVDIETGPVNFEDVAASSLSPLYSYNDNKFDLHLHFLMSKETSKFYIISPTQVCAGGYKVLQATSCY